MENKVIGRFGEELARDFLLRAGYSIKKMNLRAGYGEIDIVAEQGETLVFVEVKTRTSDKYGEADEAVDGRKLTNLKKAVERILEEKGLSEREVRLDLVAVDIDRKRKAARIKHYKDIG